MEQVRPTTSKQFGIFFEEIVNAGEGGVYAELIQDRSFEGLAFAQNFLQSSSGNISLKLPPWPAPAPSPNADLSKAQQGIVQPWAPVLNTSLWLSKEQPLNDKNPAHILLLSGNNTDGSCGIVNEGFAGVPVQQGSSYALSLYLRSLAGVLPKVTVSLQSADGNSTYATATFVNISAQWTKYKAELRSDSTDHTAVLAIRVEKCSGLAADVVSLFPQANGLEGAVSPFRQDLLQMLKDLKPGFLRFPGGCYVEGTLLSNAFLWKPSVGLIEQRPGHWNGQWEYWSTDGLGLFEYMLLAEELQAEPIWVINNGEAHADEVNTTFIQPWVQDALDSVEFMTGGPNTTWGALRASMGHPPPWNLTYFAIGNEDCGKTFYEGNYLAFAKALRAKYPQLRLISNCDLGTSVPQDLYDWHWYTGTAAMFAGRFFFDVYPRDREIFVSEYAVFEWGIQTKPFGNLGAAVAEAGFMTGMERNADIVKLAAFAPLLANLNSKLVRSGGMCASLIAYDNHRVVRTPSYYVQQAFAANAGPKLVSTGVVTPLGEPDSDGLGASTTCLDDSCNTIACKLVNFSSKRRRVSLEVAGAWSPHEATKTVLTGSSLSASNNLDHPHQVAPNASKLASVGHTMTLDLEPYSLTVLQLGGAQAGGN
ncbi:hypothetical protein WJX73_009553 [Symbiochloris irregularis]|uniref:non-reducing end alpha-L-arabinofuranosidase n=1 Tax=Symbiochloris irregularis TaxID=706552 RepID=A0AAW1NKC2_9CHLO